MRGNVTLIGRLQRVGRRTEAAGRGGDRGGAGPAEAEEGEEERKVKGTADQWGRVVSERKKKKKRWQSWAAARERLMGCWATGPKGKRGEFLFFLFFFKPFSKQPFKFKFKSNLIKLFT
jgi:hypothetical protein